ncbi:MAG TPA: glycine zipper 2TM domain-containing protein [Usitatibacter sp.]|nr:glycine zipper 2TM domain-containing protein [Usitatibacter sp.]
MTNRKTIAAMAFMAILAGACAHPRGSADYRAYEVGAEQTVRFGVVESVREVRIQPRQTGVGSTAGAVIGGVAGSHAGSGSGHIVGAIGGAILGGIVGNEIERGANERLGVEVTVLLDSGRYLAVVQDADERFRAGDRVRVLSGRGNTRVTH